MNVKNCPECGRIFNYTGRDLCPKCIGEDEEQFKRVKEYLRDNPGANIEVVSQTTEVDEKKIIRYLREGRLQLTPGSTGIMLYCERCGTQILSGRVCDNCAKDLKNGLSSGLIEKRQEELKGRDANLNNKGKIHLQDRFKRR